ncbi:MAG: hypothetical protein M3401_04405 [Actinomycetota bacterium]|nr:hypothetical protein [Actinomycetota bacterium]
MTRPRADAVAAVLAAPITVFAVLPILVSAAEPELDALAEGPLDTVAQPGVVIAVAAAVAIILVRRRWWLPLAVLVAGLTLTGWYGTELKDAFDRARPAYNLDEASNPAFPSGHARFSFFWTWLALAIATNVKLRTYARRSLIGVDDPVARRL